MFTPTTTTTAAAFTSTTTTTLLLLIILINNHEIVSLLFEIISMPQHKLVDKYNPKSKEYCIQIKKGKSDMVEETSSKEWRRREKQEG